MKTALITGINGQDGSYLAELLLAEGYKVIGIKRRSSTNNLSRLDAIIDHDNFEVVEGDITDAISVYNLVDKYKPDELYNLAAQSHVHTSFEQPQYTANVDYIGVINILEAVRKCSPDTKIYQAGTSEEFGSNVDNNGFQKEDTEFKPQSPYAVAKVAAHHMCKLYREAYGLFISVGILMNHESPRRGEEFVTRKITKWIGDNINKLKDKDIEWDNDSKLNLGNLDASRDWGHAKDFCINLDVPILTVNGWKCYDEISIGDKIINFDSKNNRLSTDIIKRKILLESDGSKIKLSGRGTYLNVSYNHRIYYQQKSVKSKGGWSSWKVCTAEELYNKIHNKSLRAKYNYRLPHFQQYTNECVKYSDDWIYLLGCLLTEGCLHRLNTGRGTVVSLSQSKIVNERIYSKIQNCLDNLNLNYRIRNRNDGVTEWIFDADSSKEILLLFDKLSIHMMPKWCYSMSCRQANILIDAMMDCDGHWGGMIYTSKRYSKRNINFYSNINCYIFII